VSDLESGNAFLAIKSSNVTIQIRSTMRFLSMVRNTRIPLSTLKKGWSCCLAAGHRFFRLNAWDSEIFKRFQQKGLFIRSGSIRYLLRIAKRFRKYFDFVVDEVSELVHTLKSRCS